MSPPTLLYTIALSLITLLPAALGSTSYANDFVDPDYILAGNFGSYSQDAESTIKQWAEDFSSTGPWSVMSKSVTPPSGDKHDYMSWSPYSWPDCSQVGNTTELSQEQVWTTCPYVTKDGQFNPDVRFVNDVGAFSNLSDAVLYNSISWAISGKGSNVYSQNNAKFLKAWFLDNSTWMNPNLNYAQMGRGPDGQKGQHTGVLDLKGFTKIVSGILIMRKGQCTDWTSDLDSQLNTWASTYITWLETASIALEEGAASNNHGSFYYNQLAALKLLVGDSAGAVNVTQTFFNGIYKKQINSNGEQPLEAARTRPYHYRAYNLAAMITSARIAKYAGSTTNYFNFTTDQGATIKTALDFAMTISASASQEDKYASELYPAVATVAAVYGDNGSYSSFLKQGEPTYASEAYYLWDQPLAPGVLNSTSKNGTDSGSTNSASPNGVTRSTCTSSQYILGTWMLLLTAYFT